MEPSGCPPWIDPGNAFRLVAKSEKFKANLEYGTSPRTPRTRAAASREAAATSVEPGGPATAKRRLALEAPADLQIIEFQVPIPLEVQVPKKMTQERSS
ncbi:hypothetical protein C2845_PM18G01300 [Panicum miliaceum]|uniref:Uncharacterized protein n=1 Tax=Panicum miliaceum TaxID=4540 RepID=A0A3L6PLX8_PANMI|nr:hypothetical protein C2845_PM18G01300 [Panicum miliaceum]